MEKQLKVFYMDYMLPEIINPKIDIAQNHYRNKCHR